MKIAQVCPCYHPHIGGIETHVGEISKRLAMENYEVDVLTTDPSGKLPREEIISDGLRIRRFRSWAPSEAYYFSKGLKKYLKENSKSYDVVHAHNYHAFPALYTAQARDRNKLIFTPHYHGTGHTFFRSLFHIPYKFLGKKIFDEADRIICVSNYEKGLIVRNFEVGDEKVVVIPNGVNLEEFRSLEKKEKDTRIILYVGRLEEYKGIQSLIKALPKLGKDTILEIVGKGPYKKPLVKLGRKLGIEDRVRFNQDLPRKELLQKYADADAFLLLSRYESFGISVAEALASKTPCIVTNTSALKDWVDEKNCFGVDYPIELNKLAELIDKVIGKRIDEMKLSSWSEVIEKLVESYKGC